MSEAEEKLNGGFLIAAGYGPAAPVGLLRDFGFVDSLCCILILCAALCQLVDG